VQNDYHKDGRRVTDDYPEDRVVRTVTGITQAGVNIYVALMFIFVFVLCSAFVGFFMWKDSIDSGIARDESKAYQQAVVKGMSDIREELAVKFQMIEDRNSRIDIRITELMRQQYELTKDITRARTVLVDIGMWPFEIDDSGRIFIQPKSVRKQIFGENAK